MAAALALSTVGVSGTAFGQAQINPDNTNQNTFIHASKDPVNVAPNSGQPVYGNTNTISGHDVKFYGYTNYNFADSLATNNSNYGTSIDITDGGGFAQINDTDYNPKGGATNNLFAVLMDPDLAFTSYGFSIALDLTGNDTANMWVFYMLTGTTTWVMATNSPLLTGGSNGQFVLSGLDPGQSFDMVAILTAAPIQMLKQNSINLVTGTPAVPEPASWALMLLGFGVIGMAIRRSRRRKPALMQIA
jgi:hypothetical protein